MRMDAAVIADHRARRKDLGVFYTDEDIVRFLVAWGMRAPRRAVLDPACGDGRFLQAAVIQGATRLVGCDIDPQAVAASRATLTGLGPAPEILAADFFQVEPASLEPVDLIVGNPPFIRYQRFTGESRRLALASALTLGTRLTGLTSSWAPMLLHATRFLRPGGALAMVVPAEIAQTQYGLPTLRAIGRRFGSVTLVTFERNIFVDALTETFLLLASEFGGSTEEARIAALTDRSQLDRLLDGPIRGRMAHLSLVEGRAGSRIAEVYLRPDEIDAWRTAVSNPLVRSIASFGDLTNGYVSGDNAFFHRTVGEAMALGIPFAWLRPTARTARSLRGLCLQEADLRNLEDGGVAHHLVVPEDGLFGHDNAALARFVAEGLHRKVPNRFKCRTRDPWWRVPGLVRADVLFSYMAGARPHAAVNEAGVIYTNSLHGLRLSGRDNATGLALAFHSSLALLSLEIEGRSYGGGILKVEPTEMERVRVPWAPPTKASMTRLALDVDSLLRAGSYERAVRRVDDVFLRTGLGLSERTVKCLRHGQRRLQERRLGRAHGRSLGSTD